jgi:hypothetical protein
MKPIKMLTAPNVKAIGNPIKIAHSKAPRPTMPKI